MAINLEIQKLISPEAAQEFADFCSDEDNINRFELDLMAEVRFLEENEIEPRLATQDIEELVFAWESPFYELQDEVRSSGEDAIYDFAHRVTWQLRQLIRTQLGFEPLTQAELESWLKLERYIPRPEDLLAGEPDVLNRDTLSRTQLISVASFVMDNFSLIYQYYKKLNDLGDTSNNRRFASPGSLRGPLVTVFLVRNHLFGKCGVDDGDSNAKIISTMIELSENS